MFTIYLPALKQTIVCISVPAFLCRWKGRKLFTSQKINARTHVQINDEEDPLHHVLK